MTSQQFKETVMPQAARMRLLALRLTANADDADDAMQDTLSRLWSCRNKLAEVNSLEAYCMTTLRHCCADILARRHPSAPMAEVADVVTDPAADFEWVEQLSRLREAMTRLPQSQKQVMRLHDLEQHSVKEIQQLTGLTASNIRVLLCRARHTLKSLFI